MYDLLIRNGRICDGSGEPSYVGSVAVTAGRIVAVGELTGPAEKVVDASGCVVAPGFIDPHTHFDAQLLWDGAAQPSLEHGVTTIVPGNCSLSLAPLKAEHREFLGATFRKIEEMPKAAFDAGINWSWESFDDYLAAIRDGLRINVAPLVGHSCLRLWVMGMAARERAATADEISQMQELLRQCLAAGAIGMSTSWVDIDHEHRPVPSRFAEMREFEALCAVLGKVGGVLQVVPEFWDVDLLCARIDILGDLSRRYGIMTTFSPLFESAATPELTDKALERVRLQVAHGAKVVPQMQTRPIDLSFDLTAPSSVFATTPKWWRTLLTPHEEKLRVFADPAMRTELIAEAETMHMPIGVVIDFAATIVKRVQCPDNTALIGRTLGSIAAERGCHPIEAMLDIALSEGLATSFGVEACGHADFEKIGRFLADPLIMIGAGDGGAHVSNFATYGDTGFLFSRYVREIRSLGVEQAVHKLSWDVARRWGISDRGLLKPGMAADIVVFDPGHFDRGPEIAVEDLPADGFRYIRRATGMRSVYVNGVLAWQADGLTDGAPAGAVVPSRLVEGLAL